MNENFWNVFAETGDPMSFLIFKAAEKAEKKNEKKPEEKKPETPPGAVM